MFSLTYMAGYMRSHFPDVPAQLLHFELRATDGSLTPVNV